VGLGALSLAQVLHQPLQAIFENLRDIFRRLRMAQERLRLFEQVPEFLIDRDLKREALGRQRLYASRPHGRL